MASGSVPEKKNKPPFFSVIMKLKVINQHRFTDKIKRPIMKEKMISKEYIKLSDIGQNQDCKIHCPMSLHQSSSIYIKTF
jgi:hypothetical protein